MISQLGITAKNPTEGINKQSISFLFD